MLNWVRSKKWLIVNALLVGILLSLLGVQVVDERDAVDQSVKIGIGNEKVITLGHVAYAAGSVDYTYDGIADNVQFQAALNALPATGGRLVDVSAVQKNFAATVTRAIPNVTIVGTGRGSYFTNNGVTDLFTAGGNNWIFQDLRTDAGDIGMGATTGWEWRNVTINATYYAYRTDDATTATSWNIPTGRGTTIFVAASNASAQEIAQADYVVNGTADDEISAALNALPANGGTVLLSSGTFNISTTANVTGDGRILRGVSPYGTILKATAGFAPAGALLNVGVGGGANARFYTISDLSLDGSSTANAQIGIDVANGNWGSIKNTYIHHFSRYGIFQHSGYTLDIDRNYIFDNGKTYNSGDTYAIGAGIRIHGVPQTSVRNNLLYVNGIGVSVTGTTSEVDISQNDIEGSTYAGAYFRAVAPSGMEHITFKDNYLDDNEYSGVMAGEQTYVKLSGNDYQSNNSANHAVDPLLGYPTSDIVLYGSNAAISIRDERFGQVNEIYTIYTTGVMNLLIDNTPVSGAYLSSASYHGNGGLFVTHVRNDNAGVLTSIRPAFNNGGFSKQGAQDFFFNAQSANTTYLQSNINLSQALDIDLNPGNPQPDVPRTLTFNFDSHGNITAYRIVIRGYSPQGWWIQESITQASGWTPESLFAYANIYSITMDVRTGTGVGDTLDVGIGSKVTLTGYTWADGDILLVTKNGSPYTGYTYDYTYQTVDLSTGGAIVTGDDFSIWYRKDSNILN